MKQSDKSQSQLFVSSLFNKKQSDSDKGLIARMKRADNPNLESQSWEYLASFHIQLDNINQRLPYTTIGAAICRSKQEVDGTHSLGEAIALCYKDKEKDSQAKMRLRRLLACDNLNETCQVLRSILALIQSRQVTLNYTELLEDLVWFNANPMDKKARWAQQFFYHQAKQNEGA